MYENDDPVTKGNRHQKSQQPQSSDVIHSLLAEIQHHHFDDSHLSHYLPINIEDTQSLKSANAPASLTETSHSNAIIQAPIKSTSTTSLPFF